jgi:hypothetical protein
MKQKRHFVKVKAHGSRRFCHHCPEIGCTNHSRYVNSANVKPQKLRIRADASKAETPKILSACTACRPPTRKQGNGSAACRSKLQVYSLRCRSTLASTQPQVSCKESIALKFPRQPLPPLSPLQSKLEHQASSTTNNADNPTMSRPRPTTIWRRTGTPSAVVLLRRGFRGQYPPVILQREEVRAVGTWSEWGC